MYATLFFLPSFDYTFVKMLQTELSYLYYENYLKRASPKAANIHNRWLSCRRQRSLRFKE